MTGDPLTLKRTGHGRYRMMVAETGDEVGVIRRDWSIRSFPVWDVFDPEGNWVRGYPSRAEAEQALAIRYWRGEQP